MNLKMIALTSLLAVSSIANASDLSSLAATASYKITITNLTRGQIFSPPVFGTHRISFSLFQLGAQASPGLAKIAEDGHTSELAQEIQLSGAAYDVVVGSSAIKPGGSQAYILKGTNHAVLSFATMLVATNDAFAGVNSVQLPATRTSFYVPAYDSGSEANTESCTHVPAPPCNAHDVRATEGAEGYVHVHAGIQGIADLQKDRYDWRNPVALVTIEKQ